MKKAWLLTVDMGYGHQRAAYPLKDLAYMRIINVNDDSIISHKERKYWRKIQHIYEFVSRSKDLPIIGNIVFGTFDFFQSISPLFPMRDLSKPTYWSSFTEKIIRRKNLFKDLSNVISKTDYPVITTFPTIALALNYHKIKNKIYCVVTDSDINRIWVPTKSRTSKITYLAPCKHVIMRLKEYGVPEGNIVLTGFPLPKENIGKNMKILKYDIKNRLLNLDPKKHFINRNKPVLRRYLGGNIPTKSNHKFTVCYLVGGAGAQKETGIIMAKSLKKRLLDNKMNLVLVAGSRVDVKKYFELRLKMIGLHNLIGKNIKIIFNEDKTSYFEELNLELRKTDLIWTKPSEMSFYAGLGIPIIMTKPLGSHEGYNKAWLEHIGAGIKGGDPRYAQEWLDYWIESGRLAHSAFDGFIEAMNLGTYNIEYLIEKNNKKTIFET